MNESSSDVLKFGTFVLDTRRRVLRMSGTGEQVALTPRLLDTLLYLAERPGDLVGKRELLEAIWPNVIVEENNLAQAISALRRALGERPGEQRYIATVPGRGYRFVADIVPGTVDAPTAQTAPRTRIPASGIAASMVVALAVVLVVVFSRDAPSGSTLLENHQRVTLGAGNHSQASIAPDGTRVAYVRDVTGVPQIWVQSLQIGDPIQVTFDDRPKALPSWSPDDRILYTELRADGAPQNIWWVDSHGTLEPSLLIRGAGHASFAFDGSAIVFERGPEIWMANRHGSNQRQVTGVPARKWINQWTWPALSPDGSQIAFYLQETGPHGDLWLIPAAGGTPRRLTHALHRMGKPVWGPDGNFIYFSSRLGGTWNLWRVSVDDGELEPVTSGVGEDHDPAISRDGSFMVYRNTRTATQFRITDSGNGGTEAVSSHPHMNWFPTASHDGTRFAFFSDLAPREQIFVVNTDGSGLRQVTFGSTVEANVMPRWAHDDQSLFYYENLTSKSLRQISASGGSFDNVMSDFEWESNMWLDASPDGEHFVYVRISPEGGPGRVVIRSIATGEERLLGDDIASLPSWSDDGTQILGTGRGGIVICDVGSLECRLLHEGRNFAPQWSRDGSRIFFSRTIDDSQTRPIEDGVMSELWVMDRDGGNARYLGIDLGPKPPLDGPFQVVADDRILWNEYLRDASQLWQANLIKR